MKYTFFTFVAFLFLTFTSCTEDNDETPTPEVATLSGEWQLDYLVNRGRPYLTSEICNFDNEPLLLNISEGENNTGSLTGNSPCNSFGSGMNNLDDDSFELIDYYATEVYCGSDDCEIDGSDYESFMLDAFVDYENPLITQVNYRVTNYNDVDSLVITSALNMDNRLYYWRDATP